MKTRTLIAKAGAVGLVTIMLLIGFVGTTVGGIGDYDCDTSATFDLIGGQDIDTGDVMIWHNTETLYIKYTTDGDWWLSETHVFVGDDIDDVPTTGKKNNPKIGHFPYSMDHDPMVQEYIYEFDLVDDLGFENGDTLFIMTHAVVFRVVDDEVVQGETAWSGDEDFPSQRWAYYFDYNPCKVLEMPDDDVNVNVATASDSYFDTTVTNGGNDVPSATYEGWCFDKFHFITPGTDYTATLYSSLDPLLPASLQDDDWDLVNYIINHKADYFLAGYSAGDIQNAIWFFFEDLTWAQLDANEKAIAQDAIDNGEGFYPAHLEYLAIIVYISDSVQGTFIEVDP